MSSSEYQIQDTRNFFIAYKKDTGKDLAIHLHNGLHNRGVDAFLDIYDIKEGLSKDEWRIQRDEHINNCDFFLLILTDGACNSDEIKYEVRLAKHNNECDIRIYVHENIWGVEEEFYLIYDNDTIIKMNDYQMRLFDTKESLLREVISSLPIIRRIQKEEIIV